MCAITIAISLRGRRLRTRQRTRQPRKQKTPGDSRIWICAQEESVWGFEKSASITSVESLGVGRNERYVEIRASDLVVSFNHSVKLHCLLTVIRSA